ncbi:hypothetical protein HanPSC8_Chr05g0207491 [Helianthus annuus]|nr:hypothetical protein HanPSC8_Chr05g0207491 [Helianthus annuus]
MRKTVCNYTCADRDEKFRTESQYLIVLYRYRPNIYTISYTVLNLAQVQNLVSVWDFQHYLTIPVSNEHWRLYSVLVLTKFQYRYYAVRYWFARHQYRSHPYVNVG